MTTWGYLILIAALTILAAIMLYARFSNRSREKSLHHPPVELMFPYESISAAPLAEITTAAVFLPGAELAASEEINEVTVDSLESPLKRAANIDKPAKQESRYFDELQEAAAGLAMLMRSSPVGRTEPVIFAPESDASDLMDLTDLELIVAEIVNEKIASPEPVEEQITHEESVFVDESRVLPESVTGEVVIPSSGIVLEDVIAEEIVLEQEETVLEQEETVLEQEETVLEQEETALAHEEIALAHEEIPLAQEEPALAQDEAALAQEEEAVLVQDKEAVLVQEKVVILSRAELLGEQVCEKLDLLDENLDALEALVFNIESSLRSLDGVPAGDAYPEGHQGSVPVAA